MTYKRKEGGNNKFIREKKEAKISLAVTILYACRSATHGADRDDARCSEEKSTRAPSPHSRKAKKREKNVRDALKMREVRFTHLFHSPCR